MFRHYTMAAVRGLMTLAFVASMAPVAQAQLVLYDDFSGARLDPARWNGKQNVTNVGGGDLLEVQREINAAQQALVLQARVIGSTGWDGGVFSAENALALRHPNSVSDIAFDVTVRKIDFGGCQAGPDAEASARGVFALFNDGGGDVIAIVSVGRSSSDAAQDLSVSASLVYVAGDGTKELGSISLGSAIPGQTVKLRARWEQAKNRVRFGRDDAALAQIDYTNAVVDKAGRPGKYFGALATVPQCTAGAGNALVLASFDNVRVQ